MKELNSTICELPFEGSLHFPILHGLIELGFVDGLVVRLELLKGLLPNQLVKFAFNRIEHLSDGSLGQDVAVFEGRLSAFRGRTVLTNILIHYVVVKFERVLEGQVVIDLASLGLNYVGLLRTGDVGQLIVLGSGNLATKEFLVFECRILLLDQTFSGRRVFLHI